MIPMVFRFCYYRENAFTDVHLLCLRSCQQFTNAHRVVVHYNGNGEGPHWDTARALPGVEWIHDAEEGLDFRLRTLEREGGFFAELDFVFLKSFEALRHHKAVIGIQSLDKQKLCSALIGAVPGCAFIKACIGASEDELWNIAKTQDVHVVRRPVFYPLCWSNRTFFKGKQISLKNSVAIHLWEPLHPDLTVEALGRTVLGPVIKEIIDGEKQAIVTCRPGGTLVF